MTMAAASKACRELCQLAVHKAGCGRSFELGGERFRVVQQLAEGGFSVVFLVRGRAGGRHERALAVKRIVTQSREQLQEAQWEIRVHRLLGNDNPNVIPLLRCELHQNAGGARGEVLLLYPLYERGSLVDLLLARAEKGEQLAEATALDLFLQVCHGLQAFHALDPPLAHRDVKPHNVLLGEGQTAVLMDFGSTARARPDLSTRESRVLLQERAARQSSMAYRAPELWEVVEGQVVDERTDVWAMGCLLFAMLFGQGYSPFECKFGGPRRSDVVDPFGHTSSTAAGGVPVAHPRECTQLGVLGAVPFPEHHDRSPALVEIVRWLLQVDPKDRPMLDAVVERVRKAREEQISMF